MPKDAPSERKAGDPRASEQSSERVFFEALEPRLLLSADLLPVTGTIDLPGEEDAYVFVLDEATEIHVDALTPGNFEWRLASDFGETLAGTTISSTDGRFAASPAAIALAAGTYTFSVAGVGAQTGEYSFALRDLADAETIAPGTAVAGSLATGRENDSYEITAEAGERISLDFEELSGATFSQVQARITGPTGQEVLDAFFNPDTTVESMRLPVSGTYFVTIEGTTPEPSEVSYRFAATRSVEPLDNPLTGDEPMLALNTRIDGRIDAAGGVDAFRFSTDSGGVFLLDALRDAADTFPAASLVVSLIDKHGETLFDRGLRFNDEILFVPPGDHLLQVRSSAPLDYAIAVRDLGAAPVLSYGDTRTATLDTAAGTALYRFEAGAGDIIRVAPEPAGSGSGPAWEIRDEGGEAVTSGSDGIGRTPLARAGTYYLLIRGELDAGAESTFDFSFDRVTDRARTLSLSAEVRDTLPPGGRDSYSFDIEAETTVILDSLANSNLRFTIDGPDGRLVDARALSSAAFYSEALVLGPGAHVLTISGVGTEAGAYGIRIFDTADAAVIQPDAPFEGSITAPGTADVRRIDLTDGQTLTVETQNRGGGAGRFTLLSETGEILTRQSLNVDFGPVTAVGNTTYYLMVDAQHDAESLDYTLTPRIAKVIREDLELGTLTTAALETPYSVATYDFTLTAPRTLYFDTLISSGGTVRVLDASGRFVAAPSLSSDRAENLMVLGAGAHRLEMSFSGFNVGQVPFRLSDAGVAPELAVNGEYTITLDPARANEVRRIDLEAGSLLYLDIIAREGSRGVRLYDPSGRALALSTGADQQAVRIAAAGTYVLVIEVNQSASTTETGSITFGIWEQRDQSRPLTPGAPVSGEIERPGDTWRHGFEVATAGRYHFDSLTNRADLDWELREVTTGAVIAGQTFNSQTSGREAVFDLSAGDYEIVVTGRNDATGAYGFRLTDLAATPVIARDTATPVEPDAQGSALFRFAAEVGDRFVLTPGSLADAGVSTNNLIMRVIDPQGNEVVTRRFATSDPFVARFAGDYSLIVDAAHAVGDALETTLTLTDDGPAPQTVPAGAAMVIGDLVEGAITDPGGSAAHVFTLTEKTELLFDSRSDINTIQWRIEDVFGARTDPRTMGASVLSGYYGIGFDRPGAMVLGPGTYRVALSATGSNTGSYAFHLVDLGEAREIDLDTAVDVTVDPGNAAQVLSFDAAKGDRLSIDDVVVTGGNSSAGRFQLIGPDGSILRFGSSESWPLSSRPFFAEASLDGQYRLLVAGSNGGAAPFALSFAVRKQVVRDAPVTFGEPIEGTLSAPSEVVRHAFSVTEPTLLTVDSLTDISSFRWTLRDNTGVIGSADMLRTQTVPGTGSSIFQLGAGDYVFEISNTSAVTGDYRITLLDPSDAPTIDAPTGGQPVAVPVTIPAGARTGMVQVDLVEGVRYHGWFTDTAGLAGRIGVLSPFGEVLHFGSQGNDPGSFVARHTGAHTFIFNSNATLDDGGQVTLSLRRAQLVAADIAIGAIVEGGIDQPGDAAVYRFTVAEGGQYYLDSQTNNNGLDWRIVGPTGTQASGDLAGDNGVSQLQTLPAGAYQLFITGTQSIFGQDDFTGDFRFRLIDLAGATRVEPGSYLDATLNPGNATRAFTFPGKVGDRLFLQVLEAEGSAVTWLLSPSGVQLNFGNLGNSIDGLRLPESGEYILLVGGPERRVAESRFVYNIFTNSDRAPQSINPASPGADLVPSALAVTGAGGAPVQAGAPVIVEWRTQNDGTADAAAFTERLIVRNVDLGAVIAVIEAPAEALAAGAGRDRQATLTLPPGAAGTGALSFTLATDVLNAVAEPGTTAGAEGGEVSTEITSLSDRLPDLVVADVSMSPPADWQPGDPVTVSWVTRNTGAAAAAGPWGEQLRIRNTLTNTEILLADVPYAGDPIAAGAEVARSFTLPWPGGRPATGAFEVTVSTDNDDAVVEGNDAGDAASNNSTTQIFASAPDLVVENLRILETAPSAGGEVTVVWDVVNQGNAVRARAGPTG